MTILCDNFYIREDLLNQPAVAGYCCCIGINKDKESETDEISRKGQLVKKKYKKFCFFFDRRKKEPALFLYTAIFL